MNYELFQHPNKNIFLINMTRELDPYFSELVKRGIEKYLSQGKKIWILLNKKWFSGGTICPRCGHIPQCDHCSVAINYYHLPGGEKRGMCHICKKQYRYPSSCEACWSVEIKEYGLGTQKLAELLKTEFWAESLIVESESVKSPSKITKFYAQLQPLTKPWKAPVIIWTSLLTTPIKGWTFDLLIYLDADMGLNIPDYNANEKNFYFLYEGFVKHQTPVFLVQTLNPEQYSIRSACKMSESDFFLVENAFRKEHLYPPFGELCLILYKDEIEQKLFNKVDQLHKELLYLQQKYQLQDLEIYTTPPLIYKIFGKYRYQVVIKGKEVRNFMDIVYSKLQLHKKGFKINWMAETMV